MERARDKKNPRKKARAECATFLGKAATEKHGYRLTVTANIWL
jgi:hypothetical protein